VGYSREEICNTTRRYDTCYHQHENIHSYVFDCQFESPEYRSMVFVCFTCVFFESPYSQISFFGRQPSRCSWEIRENKEGTNCHKDRHCTFDDLENVRVLKIDKSIGGSTNIHLQARRPLAPSSPPTMPAAISPEKAPEIRDPE
jgi:hypothetical protein